MQHNQIRIREIAVVMRLFLAAHGQGLTLRLIPAARLLNDDPAVIQNLSLAELLVLQTAQYAAEGVHVLQLGADTELFLAYRTQTDVSVAAHRAFFHFHVGNIAVLHDRADFLQISTGLFRRAQVGFRDNLNQRCTYSVEID
ncbi:hypothetical protein D3C73_1088770 [compost metagenome]